MLIFPLLAACSGGTPSTPPTPVPEQVCGRFLSEECVNDDGVCTDPVPSCVYNGSLDTLREAVDLRLAIPQGDGVSESWCSPLLIEPCVGHPDHFVIAVPDDYGLLEDADISVLHVDGTCAAAWRVPGRTPEGVPACQTDAEGRVRVGDPAFFDCVQQGLDFIRFTHRGPCSDTEITEACDNDLCIQDRTSSTDAPAPW